MPDTFQRRVSGVRLVRLGVWLIVAALFVAPLALVVSLALGDNQFPLLLQQGLGEAAANSVVTTVASSAFAVVLGGLVALLLERTDVYGKNALRILLLSPLLIPPFVGAISWLQLL